MKSPGSQSRDEEAESEQLKTQGQRGMLLTLWGEGARAAGNSYRSLCVKLEGLEEEAPEPNHGSHSKIPTVVI